MWGQKKGGKEKKKRKKKNYREVSLMVQTALTFLFGILRVIFSPPKHSNNQGKAEGPREAKFNYLEIRDQYLSTFDNMLIICTPQNSIPTTAIG